MKTTITEWDVSPIFGKHEPVHQIKHGPLSVWVYKDHKLAGGLFRLHDQEGFSLTDSLRECRKHGLEPCLKEFAWDALRAGWSQEKIDRTIMEAQSDSCPTAT